MEVASSSVPPHHFGSGPSAAGRRCPGRGGRARPSGRGLEDLPPPCSGHARSSDREVGEDGVHGAAAASSRLALQQSGRNLPYASEAKCFGGVGDGGGRVAGAKARGRVVVSSVSEAHLLPPTHVERRWPGARSHHLGAERLSLFPRTLTLQDPGAGARRCGQKTRDKPPLCDLEAAWVAPRSAQNRTLPFAQNGPTMEILLDGGGGGGDGGPSNSRTGAGGVNDRCSGTGAAERGAPAPF